jgi:hypothetical protein
MLNEWWNSGMNMCSGFWSSRLVKEFPRWRVGESKKLLKQY